MTSVAQPRKIHVLEEFDRDKANNNGVLYGQRSHQLWGVHPSGIPKLRKFSSLASLSKVTKGDCTMAGEDSSRGTVREIPLELLDIGTAQVRTDLSTGIEDLAASIRKQGLLQPIIVAEKPNGRFEILAGQRRFLAHQKLGYKTIRAIVSDSAGYDEDTKVAISLTENLIRRDNSQKELIDACTKLFKRYGSVKMVADETGLPATVVSQYVKYDQLIPELKQKVDGAQMDMRVALQAQKAATASDGVVDPIAASKFAAELTTMSNVQRKNFLKTVTEDPAESVEEKIERGKKQPVIKQVIVSLEASLHKSLQKFAKSEGVNQDEAAATLIEDGLSRRDLLEE